MQYVIVIEKAGDNLSAWFPDVPGCGTVGDTVEEVLANAEEALEGHLEDMEAPAARPLKAILDEGLEVDGTELFGFVPYEQRHAAA